MRYFDKLNSEISSSTFLLRMKESKFYFIFLTISKPTPIKINNPCLSLSLSPSSSLLSSSGYYPRPIELIIGYHYLRWRAKNGCHCEFTKLGKNTQTLGRSALKRFIMKRRNHVSFFLHLHPTERGTIGDELHADR